MKKKRSKPIRVPMKPYFTKGSVEDRKPLIEVDKSYRIKVVGKGAFCGTQEVVLFDDHSL